MWNSFNTGDYSGMIAETKKIRSKDGQEITVYHSRPLTDGVHPGIVLIPHMPGWDEWCRETARRFTEHGYSVVCPDIYSRFGTGTPSEVANRRRENGLSPDKTVMADTAASIEFLRDRHDSNGKVGVIGMCSGGRHTFLAACTLEGIDAAVDCWGGGVIMPDEELSPARPVSPHTLTANLSCPLLGIFGNDDRRPDVNEVNRTEELLKKYEKKYEFHRYDGATHGIWYYHTPMYRQQQAMDSWNVVLEFFDKNLK